MTVEPFERMLSGGDRRSIGRANEAAAQVQANPARFGELFELVFAEDAVVRMRAADAVEKASAKQPELLLPYKARILHEMAAVDQQEVRWHAAQLLPRLALAGEGLETALEVLQGYLLDDSRIVQVNAMQALADLAVENPQLRTRVVPLLVEHTRSGSPAVRSRGKKLLASLGVPDRRLDEWPDEPPG